MTNVLTPKEMGHISTSCIGQNIYSHISTVKKLTRREKNTIRKKNHTDLQQASLPITQVMYLPIRKS